MGQKDKVSTPQGETATQTRPRAVQPPMFKVLLHNDDYTTMEFVVHVLQKFFQKSMEEATQIMLHVHHKGMGICGLYPFEIAETKVSQVVDYARKNDYPLQCTMEEAG
jgi:ATP-dependent Clp protease adaptor protein ClpS